MNTQERYLKITELLREFKYGDELYKTNPMFHQAIQMIINGATPYEALEQIVMAAQRLQDAFEDFMRRDTRPIEFNTK